MPAPTLWPAALSLGATVLVWGLISSLLMTGIGVMMVAIAIVGWINDIRHEHDS
jgi:hypothetical protein